MNSSILSNKQRYAVVVLSVMLSLMVVWAAANGATTISANVSTDGTLAVTGASTLSSATMSTTLGVTGLSTFTGGYVSVASSTAVAALNVGGPLSASSTLIVNNLSTFTGGYVSVASSTVSGNFNSSGKITAGASSTPSYELGASGTATTTLALHSTSSATGGCIQILGSDGTTMYKMYFGQSDTIGTATTSWRGGTAYIALWEEGSCK